MISVVMAACGAGPAIEKAIESILNQTVQDLELLIVDDVTASPEALSIIRSFADRRIRFVTSGQRGAAAARNHALALVRGAFVAFQEPDDESLPMRLDVLRRSFHSDSVALVHSDVIVTDAGGRPLRYEQGDQVEPPARLRRFLRGESPYQAFLVRAERLAQHRFDPAVAPYEEADFAWQVTRGAETVHVPEPLYMQRERSRTDGKLAFLNKVLAQSPLTEVVPEVEADDTARACAVIGSLLFEQGLAAEASKWLQQGLALSRTQDSQLFLSGMTHLLMEQPARAAELFSTIGSRDHLVLNYLGAACGRMGQMEQAMSCLRQALQIRPDYLEALDNLRAVGGSIGMNLIDSTWAKYRR